MDGTLPIVVRADSAREDEFKGRFFKGDEEYALADVPIAKLKESLEGLCKGVADAFSNIREVGRFRLDEVTLQVEVNASGGVELIGTSSAGGKGAIRLKFKA